MSASFFNRFNNLRDKGLVYPSPFFDIAQTYMPPTVKELFKWCKYYYYTHPIINPVVYKMAEYPITDLIYQELKEESQPDAEGKSEPDEHVKDTWKEILEEILDIKTTMINSGLNFFSYGNCFLSIFFPFLRFLKCASCDRESEIGNVKDWEYKDFNFQFTCPICSNNGIGQVRDQSIKDRHQIRIFFWDPENIDLHYNQLTGKAIYTYKIPNKLRNNIRVGKKQDVDGTPLVFLEAVKEGKDIRFEKSNFYHLKRQTLAESDQGWGKPLILPAMRDAFYMQVLRKANEAIAFQYIVPLSVIFPQANGTLDPYQHISLPKWRDRIERELAAWKDDPNHIPIMPIPVGYQQIFGNSRALMITPEIKALAEQMVTGMGVPPEFVFGGLSYSGSSVSLRIVENHLLRYRESLTRLLNFIVDRISRNLGIKKVSVRFRDFKMADDIQQQQLLSNFVQSQHISARTGLQQLGMDYKDEEQDLKKENEFRNELQKDALIAQAEAQGEALLIQSRYQNQAEFEMQQDQLQMQSKLLENNPEAMQYMMEAQQGAAMPPEGGGAPAEGGMPVEGAPAEGAPTEMIPSAATSGAVPPPEQTQYHEGPMTPGYGPGPDGGEVEMRAVHPLLLAMSVVKQLENISNPELRRSYIEQMQQKMPTLHSLVSGLQRTTPEKPLPPKLPPRRQGGSPI